MTQRRNLVEDAVLVTINHPGTQPARPDEGLYDIRLGATAYAPIVAAFGALAVTAIVVVFTSAKAATHEQIALAAGLLAVGVLGSLVGSFGLAAIGAERDATANLPPAIMYIAVPVAVSIEAVLGAFGVLAKVYIPDNAKLFLFVTAAGGIFGVILTAFVVGDVIGLHPTTMTPQNFDAWRSRQWLKDTSMAYRWTNIISTCGVLPPIAALVVRVSGIDIRLTQIGVNLVVGVALTLAVTGTLLSLNRTQHPALGNEQKGLRIEEAWGTVMSISLFSVLLLLVLP